ncbi:MAG: hypothetical protein O2887_01935 [Bacteroidetes bacterium]|nr:hypothetical protein [Bacteroidota bacterium]MDA1119250.1 hypothetical protein [Bacteroidota bacterium]
MESKLNQESIEAYSRNVADKILSNFFQTKKIITGQEVLGICPVKQVNFFILKNLFTRWQEETQRLESPYFDYKNETVKKAVKSLMNALSQNILIDEDDFRPLLEEAISETLLIILSPYDYYHQNFNKSPSLSLKYLQSQAKYVRINKHLYMILLDALESDMNSDKIEKEDIISKLDSILKSTNEAPEDIESYIEQFGQIHPIKVETFFIEDHPLTAQDEEEISQLQKKLFQEFEEMDEIAIEKSKQQLNDRFVKGQKTLNEKLATETVDIATSHATKKIDSILKSVSLNNKYMFVKELFNGETHSFENAIEEVEQCKSFEDAVGYLVQHHAKYYGWEMQSSEVKELLRVIIKKFKN